MEESKSISVIIRDLRLNPKCRHGPTILFSSGIGNKFFSCAGVRSRDCFYLDYQSFKEGHAEEYSKSSQSDRRSLMSYHEVQNTKPDLRIFCKTCGIFLKSLMSHESHNVIRGIQHNFLEEPSLSLPQLDNDKFNAQYFFDQSTLDFIVSIFESLKLNKILCIGAPRLHDFIRSKKPHLSSILLDIDDRFEAFNHEKNFIHYNMFNNHFFNNDKDKLDDFLKDNKEDRSSHCLFSDPPFAARTELLDDTFRKISQLFKKVNSSPKILPIFLVFPYFNECHVQKFIPEMEMLDFQVSYMNHKAYHESFKGRKEGSPIRIFTNIDQRIIKYPLQYTNYRHCKPCKRFVSISNQHCKLCRKCPSKNGATYRHCLKCKSCVKPNYIHCKNCCRCVQKSNHDCKFYQRFQICRKCSQKGHVESKCKES